MCLHVDIENGMNLCLGTLRQTCQKYWEQTQIIGEKVMEMVENRPTNYENIGVSKLLAGTFPPARAPPTSKPACMFRSLRVKLHIIGLQKLFCCLISIRYWRELGQHLVLVECRRRSYDGSHSDHAIRRYDHLLNTYLVFGCCYTRRIRISTTVLLSVHGQHVDDNLKSELGLFVHLHRNHSEYILVCICKYTQVSLSFSRFTTK